MNTLETLQHTFPEDLDGAVFVTQPNTYYFSGFPARDGLMLVTREDAVYITDFRYIEAAKAGVKTCRAQRRMDTLAQIGEFFKKAGAKRIGVESRGMTLSMFSQYQSGTPELSWDAGSAISDACDRLRMIKLPWELELIRKAEAIAEEAMTEIIPMLRPGLSEREIGLRIEIMMRERGAEGVSFEPIVASGENSAVPHHATGERTLRPGDFVTIDIGCRVNGYCSDMTRTVALGQVTDEMRHVYDTVLKAQQAAFTGIRPGARCKDVDQLARQVIDMAGYEGCFGHGLGHSLGLLIHEDPRFSAACDTVLSPGMVLSVEPGIYLEGRFGVRIEDIIVVTETGFENLNRCPKELSILPV